MSLAITVEEREKELYEEWKTGRLFSLKSDFRRIRESQIDFEQFCKKEYQDYQGRMLNYCCSHDL